MLRDEVEPLGANRPIRPGASPAAGRRCVLAVTNEVRSSVTKAIVTKEASCDELNAPFSEASLVTALRLLMGLDIQEHEASRIRIPGSLC